MIKLTVAVNSTIKYYNFLRDYFTTTTTTTTTTTPETTTNSTNSETKSNFTDPYAGWDCESTSSTILPEDNPDSTAKVEKTCTVCIDPIHHVKDRLDLALKGISKFCAIPTPNNKCGRMDTDSCEVNPNNYNITDLEESGIPCVEYPNYWNVTETCITKGFDKHLKNFSKCLNPM